MTTLFEQCDFHVHTRLSSCASAEMTAGAIAETCVSRGIRYIGLADHVAVNTDYRIFAQSRQEISRLDLPAEVFLGCEVDILGVGRHLVTDRMVSELDFIGVAANHFHDGNVDRPENESMEAVGRHFLEMFRYACTLEFADFVAHPMYVYPGTFDPTCLELIGDEDIAEALALARKNDIAMEISPRVLDRAQMFFRMRFLKLCKDAGVKFSIGSDAHRLDMAGMTRLVAPIVRELGLNDEDIWLPRGALQSTKG